MALTCIFAYVLLFVIKCRFPANKSVAEILRGRYDNDVLAKTRRLEKLDFKREHYYQFNPTTIEWPCYQRAIRLVCIINDSNFFKFLFSLYS